MNSEMEDNLSSTESFKKPLPIGPSLDHFKKPSTPTVVEAVSGNEQISKDDETKIDSNIDNKSSVLLKKSEKSLVNIPLPYQEPQWSGHPPSCYNLEIIKNGTFVSTLPIKSSLVVFGRLEVCDVIFEHPSVSRYHAIIQYCQGDDTHLKGFYVYDLGSTHGTFLNKEKIKPKIYYKLKVGYILKFGGSSRLHIFQGPDEEEEEVKEIKAVIESDEEGCNWGMGEEAAEEDDLTENPFAMSTLNEELYIDDPKKTLRGWFEREGYELEYNVEEKGYGTFLCKIRLPVDTATGEYLPVEASVSGKKKEAVVACALEACRTLDQMGLLRQSHQESRQPKRKKWEENDYYDSDEDTFYDRTGEIEKRREMRKRLAKKVEVHNYESLSVKLEKLNAEMEEIKNKISCDNKSLQNSQSNESDSLDMYMSSLSASSNTISDKFERRKLKLRLIELEKEKVRLEKLSDIAKPAKMPPIAKHPGIIGKKLKSKLKITPLAVAKTDKVKEDDQMEEKDSDDEADNSNKVDSEKNSSTVKYGLIMNPVVEVKEEQAEKEDSIQIECSFKNRDNLMKTSKNNDDSLKQEKLIIQSNLNANAEMTNPTLQQKNPSQSSSTSKSDNPLNQLSKSSKSSRKKESSANYKNVDIYKTRSEEYCTWMPPSNQSGDGMTYLNKKYGY